MDRQESVPGPSRHAALRSLTVAFGGEADIDGFWRALRMLRLTQLGHSDTYPPLFALTGARPLCFDAIWRTGDPPRGRMSAFCRH